MSKLYTYSITCVPAGNGHTKSLTVGISTDQGVIYSMIPRSVFFHGPDIYTKDGVAISQEEYAALSEDEKAGWDLVSGLITREQLHQIPLEDRYAYTAYGICKTSGWNDDCDADGFSDANVGGASACLITSSSVCLNRDNEGLYDNKVPTVSTYNIQNYGLTQQSLYEQEQKEANGGDAPRCYDRKYADYEALKEDYNTNVAEIKQPDDDGQYHAHFQDTFWTSPSIGTKSSFSALNIGPQVLMYEVSKCDYDFETDEVLCVHAPPSKSSDRLWIYFGTLSVEHILSGNTVIAKCTFKHPSHSYAVLVHISSRNEITSNGYQGDEDTIYFEKLVYVSGMDYSLSDYTLTLPGRYPSCFIQCYGEGASYAEGTDYYGCPYTTLSFNYSATMDDLFYTYTFTGSDPSEVSVDVEDDSKIYDGYEYHLYEGKYPHRKGFVAGDGTVVPVMISYSMASVGPNAGEYRILATLKIDNDAFEVGQEGAVDYSSYHLEGRTSYLESVIKEFSIIIEPKRIEIGCADGRMGIGGGPNGKYYKMYDGTPHDLPDECSWESGVPGETLTLGITYDHDFPANVCDLDITSTYEVVGVAISEGAQNTDSIPGNYLIEGTCEHEYTICPRWLKVEGDAVYDPSALADPITGVVTEGVALGSLVDGEYGIDLSNLRISGVLDGEAVSASLRFTIEDDWFPNASVPLSGYNAEGEDTIQAVRYLCIVADIDMADNCSACANYRVIPRLFPIFTHSSACTVEPFGDGWFSTNYDGSKVVEIDGRDVLFEEAFTIRFKLQNCDLYDVVWDGKSLYSPDSRQYRERVWSGHELVEACEIPDESWDVDSTYCYCTSPVSIEPNPQDVTDPYGDNCYYEMKIYSQPRSCQENGGEEGSGQILAHKLNIIYWDHRSEKRQQSCCSYSNDFFTETVCTGFPVLNHEIPKHSVYYLFPLFETYEQSPYIGHIYQHPKAYHGPFNSPYTELVDVNPGLHLYMRGCHEGTMALIIDKFTTKVEDPTNNPDWDGSGYVTEPGSYHFRYTGNATGYYDYDADDHGGYHPRWAATDPADSHASLLFDISREGLVGFYAEGKAMVINTETAYYGHFGRDLRLELGLALKHRWDLFPNNWQVDKDFGISYDDISITSFSLIDASYSSPLIQLGWDWDHLEPIAGTSYDKCAVGGLYIHDSVVGEENTNETVSYDGLNYNTVITEKEYGNIPEQLKEQYRQIHLLGGDENIQSNTGDLEYRFLRPSMQPFHFGAEGGSGWDDDLCVFYADESPYTGRTVWKRSTVDDQTVLYIDKDALYQSSWEPTSHTDYNGNRESRVYLTYNYYGNFKKTVQSGKESTVVDDYVAKPFTFGYFEIRVISAYINVVVVLYNRPTLGWQSMPTGASEFRFTVKYNDGYDPQNPYELIADSFVHIGQNDTLGTFIYDDAGKILSPKDYLWKANKSYRANKIVSIYDEENESYDFYRSSADIDPSNEFNPEDGWEPVTTQELTSGVEEKMAFVENGKLSISTKEFSVTPADQQQETATTVIWDAYTNRI